MECKYCGAKLRDGAKFCPKCGKKVKPAKSGAKGPKPKAAPSGGKEERKVQPAPPKEQAAPSKAAGRPEQAGMPDYIAGPGERAGMPDHVAWPGAAAAGSPVQPKKKGKGCLIGGIIGVVILAAAIAGAVFLWKGGLLDSLPDLPFLKQEANPEGEKSGEDSQGDEIISDPGEEGEGESGSEEQEDHWSPEDVELTVPGARPGDYEIIELEENENGMCTVTPQLIREYIPEATTCYFDNLPRLGNDIDDYIKNSYVFAHYIKSGIDEAYTGEGNRFDRNLQDGVYLLIFQWKDNRPYLSGYFAGVPEESEEEGKWLLKVTPCEYDLTELYEEENARFQPEKDEVLTNYIDPEDVEDSGAAYYLVSFDSREGEDVQEDDARKYRLWQQLHSDYVENYARDIERFESQTVSPGRQRCYLLLDEDYESIGYTVLTEETAQASASAQGEQTQDVGRADYASGEAMAAASDGELPTSGDYTAIYVHEDENGNCRVNPDVVQQYIPESTTSCFTGSPNLGDDIEDYLRDSYTFADLISRGMDGGISGDGSSFNPKDDPDSTYCLLVFQRRDNHPYLTGYYFGKPEQYDEDTWLLKVTPCDYDLEELYERESKQYQEEKELLLANYIAPEDVEDSGAVYYVEGYNTGQSSELREDECQLYHLWSQMSSPFLERFARPIGRMPHDVNKTREGRWKGFILMNRNYEVIGYTMVYGGDE